MCYSSGALQRFNPLGRVLGDKGYKLVDPGMAATERATDKALTRAFDPEQPTAQTYDAPGAPLQDIPTPKRRATPNSLLTGPSVGTPTSSSGTGLTLLGG